MRILLLVPEMFGHVGGIQRAGRLLCAALVDSDPEMKLDVLSLMDAAPSDPPPGVLRHARVRFVPCDGGKLKFLNTLRRLSSEFVYDGAISTNLNLAPALFFFRHRFRWTAAQVHGLELKHHFTLIRRMALRQMDQIVPNSRFTLRILNAHASIAPERIRLLPLALPPPTDQGLFTSAPVAPSKPPEGRFILTVGRMERSERYKGHEEIIRTLPAVLARVPGLHYLAVGPGDLIPELQALADGLGVGGRVRFPGELSESGLRWYYEHASLFAMPSRCEGFGLVYLEAMSFGLPVVAGREDAGSEIIEEGRSGFLVDPKDGTALTAALLRLLEDDDLRRRMGAEAQRTVATRYTYEGYVRRIREFIHSTGTLDRSVDTDPARTAAQR